MRYQKIKKINTSQKLFEGCVSDSIIVAVSGEYKANGFMRIMDYCWRNLNHA